MNDKMMILYFMRLLLEKGEILINHKPIINVKSGEIEIVSIDIKYKSPFCQKDFMKKIYEMDLYFDLLDLYIEEGFEILEILHGKLGTHISIMISIEEDIIEQEYFVEWIKYIGAICGEFGIQKKQIIIEVKTKETKELKPIECSHELVDIIDKVLEKGYQIALPIESEICRLENNFIRIVDLNKSNIDSIDLNEGDNILVRIGKCLNTPINFKHKYVELNEDDGDNYNKI